MKWANVFTYSIKLDAKSRLVLPIAVREKLSIKDSVSLSIKGDKIVITPDELTGDRISKNHYETARIV